ncbi:hypothetical protein L0657_10140 [Dyadobacter sp. CY345]|uniref:hypothetical protein n=1 Tax=Dyadobacter sp. CY345 TaxID=2909335 RepID=UPI001F366164|nr:hypothetical protein [Dyadobacter sp. CY345]MCF2444316.1 hypothetical protein [Dyadobacter sp. CY345]
MSTLIKSSFTNLQQELLKLYAREISEEDLANIRDLIGQYFLQRLTTMADSAWDKNGWDQQDMENMLNENNQ